MKNIKRNLACLLVLLLAFSTVGCEDKQAAIYNKYIETISEELSNATETKEIQGSEKNLSGELVIYTNSFGHIYSTKMAAEKFNEVYPDVKITLVGSKDLVAGDEYTLQTTVALMSGKVADIIDLQYLPYYRYTKSGLFEDLYTYIEKDSEFKEEDYFTNIFKALEYEGGLYSIQFDFWYPICRLNNRIVKALDIDISSFEAVSFNEIHEIYMKSIEEGKAPEDLMISKFFTNGMFDPYEYPVYLDEANNISNFNSEGFIEYLKKVKEINWPITINESEFIESFYSLEMDENSLMLTDVSMFIDSRMAEQFSKDSDEVTVFIPWISSDGKKPFQLSDDGPFAIMKDSENKELAWEFIKFHIQETDHSETVFRGNFLRGGIPINKKNARQLLEKSFGEGHEEDIEKIMQWCMSLDNYSMTTNNASLMFVLYEICQDYYNDLISAEECARRVQERVEIYLKE